MKTYYHFEDLKISIECDIEPFEKQTRDYPGCPGGAVLCSVTFRGHDFPLDLFTKEEVRDMEKYVYEEFCEKERAAYEEAQDSKYDEWKDERKLR